MSQKERIPFTESEVNFIKKINQKRVTAEARFPLITALFATFGFVSLLSGFEKIIDSIDFLSNNPIVLFMVGLIILVLTGTVYKKLN